MLRRTSRFVLAALLAATTTVVGLGSQTTAEARSEAGPPYYYVDALFTGGREIPLKNKAMITRTKRGYIYRSGMQDNRIKVTKVRGGIRIVDTGTQRWERLVPGCKRRAVPKGIAAVCRIPAWVSAKEPLLFEVWPRLGNDYMDARTLPASVALTFLGDLGHDTAFLGAGPDFFNGHSGRDRVYGGAGNDWLRMGSDNDFASGGPGADDLVGMIGRDRLIGGRGDDKIDGMDSGDWLYGGPGRDRVGCGNHNDYAQVDAIDTYVRGCETIDRR